MLAIPASKKDIPDKLSATKLSEKNNQRNDVKIKAKNIKANKFYLL